MSLAGFKFIQTWEGFVYHFTGRGAGSFNGDKARHEQWMTEMNNSTLDFIRKWGSNVNHTPMMEPIVSPKYDIGFIVENCTLQFLSLLEPWCSNIYINDYNFIGKQYIETEQKNTSFDLKNRIKPYTENKQNEILISFDCKKLNQTNYQFIQQLPDIIKNSGEIGEFELDIFLINIREMNEYQNKYIKL
jgi:hypothetical protein